MIYQVHQQDAELRGEERGEQKEKIRLFVKCWGKGPGRAESSP